MSRTTTIAIVLIGVVVLGAFIVASTSAPVPMPFNTPVVTKPRTMATVPSATDKDALPVLADHMPEFKGITKWWNTTGGEPLTPEKLKGKVVLIDFWTYSCINCIRTYPFIKSMHDKYADKGLVIIGVHTPEFAFEAVPENVEREINKNGFTHPIALDPDYATWNAYSNHYWPAEYFFDREGRLRRTHFGEGEYDESEEAIRSLLTESGAKLEPMGTAMPTPDFSSIATPETYFGLNRGDAFMGTPGADNADVTLRAADPVSPNHWTASGVWSFRPEYVQANSADAVFRFNVKANKLHIVMESSDGKDKRLEVYVDGKKTGEVTINASTLYTISEFPDDGRHTVEIRVRDPGVRFYAATFS